MSHLLTKSEDSSAVRSDHRAVKPGFNSPTAPFFAPVPRFYSVLSQTLGHIQRVRRQVKQGTFDQPTLHRTMLEWGNEMLTCVGCEKTVVGHPGIQPMLFVGNHVSYMDIPLLMSVAPVSFVAKKQLAAWPLFGWGMKHAGVTFVDRECKESRKKVGELIAPRILEEGQSVVIFPSGTTTLDEHRPWRHGPFQIAMKFNIPIQPFRLRYEPIRNVGFILEDAFAGHLWNLLRQGKFQAFIEFAPPQWVTDPVADSEKWWEWSRAPLIEG